MIITCMSGTRHSCNSYHFFIQWLSLFLSLVVTGCHTHTHSLATPIHEPISGHSDVEIGFMALWWSEHEMDGIVPDDPPEKTTLIELRQWDPSDPISTPHPDNYIVAVKINSAATSKRSLYSAEQRFHIGPLTEPSSAKWTEWEPLDLTVQPNQRLGAGTLIPIGEIDIRTKLNSLFSQDMWIHAHGVRALLSDTRSSNNTEVSGLLRILPAD